MGSSFTLVCANENKTLGWPIPIGLKLLFTAAKRTSLTQHSLPRECGVFAVPS